MKDRVNTNSLAPENRTGKGGFAQKRGRGYTYADGDGAALAALLGGKRVGDTEVDTPVSTTDGDDAELGNDDGSADSSSDFLRGLDTETDVALRVANDDNGLESGSLTGTGLLLDGLDLLGGEKKVRTLAVILSLD